MSAAQPPIVAIVDDDASVRKALARLLRSADQRVETFSRAQQFLEYSRHDAVGCLVLDVQLPDLDGLQLQAALERLKRRPPIVFLTGHGDIPMTVRAMRAGAVDFLTKPCDAPALLDAVARALQIDTAERRRELEHATERARFAGLTKREHEVLRGVTAGLLNKQIAAGLGICEKTVKVHRAHIMEKTGFRSVAELVRVCEHLGIGAAESRPTSRFA